MAAKDRNFLRLVGESPDQDALAPAPSTLAAQSFPEPYTAPWLRACRRIRGAGYGEAIVQAFERAAPACALKVGPEAALKLTETVSAVAIKAGRLAAETLCQVAPVAVDRLAADHQRFRSWLSLMERFAVLAPESSVLVLQRTDMLLSTLRGVAALEAWLLAGVRTSGDDADKRLAFFSMESVDAERWLQREAGEVVFADQERRMKAYLAALFGVRVPVREPASNAPEASRRRAGFAPGLIRMPPTFPGFRGAQAEAIFRAALAHIGAHYRFGGPPIAVGKLKPVQLALVGIVEDARVEHLAMEEMPGLARLWLPFHIAQATGATNAPSLFARLARSLIDPHFHDPNAWVAKGQAMFFDNRARWGDPSLSRHMGNLLGNDLGQMRVQFNAKTYVVEPPYRDDGLGLWAPPEDEPPAEEDQAEVILDSVRLQQTEDPEDVPDREREETEHQEEANRASAATLDADQGVPVARYPEYDHLTGRERAEWTTVLEYLPPPGDAGGVGQILARRATQVAQLTALIRQAKVSRAQRQRRQAEGETLDLDAAIEATIDHRAGLTPDPGVYQTMARRHRDLSVLVLMDISQSTADRVIGSTQTVLETEREATVLLAHAMDQLGDPFAVAAFASNQRDDVRYIRVKDFCQPFDGAAQAALMGLKAGYSTRLGAALRHAGADLALQQTHRRLVLVITDGEPSDRDCPDPAYLVADARRAVQSLAHRGIDVFCVGLDGTGESYLHPIFGRRNVVQIDRIDRLPERLPMLYLRLTS